MRKTISKNKSLEDLLAAAIRDGMAVVIIHTLNNSGEQPPNLNVVSDDDKTHSTLLHRYVVQGTLKNDLVTLRALLAHGADSSIPNSRYQSAIELACTSTESKPRASKEVISELILQRKIPSDEEIDYFINVCNLNYSEDPNKVTHNFRILAHTVSAMLCTNLGEIFKDPAAEDRYMIHLCEYISASKVIKDNTGRDTSVSLEGFKSKTFLPMRILSFLEILIKLQRNILEHSDGYQQLCDFLKNQIIQDVITFIIRQTHDYIYELFFGNPAEKDELCSSLAAWVHKVLTARNEVTLATGYNGHALYVHFNLVNNGVKVRFDNLGSGSEPEAGLHERDTDGKVKSTYLSVSDIGNDAARLRLIEYIKLLLVAPTRTLPPQDKTDYEKAQRIVSTFFSTPLGQRNPADSIKKISELMASSQSGAIISGSRAESLRILKELYGQPEQNYFPWTRTFSDLSFEPQKKGTCVATNHNVGIHFRLQNKDLAAWLFDEEKRIIKQHKRTSSIQEITEHSELWTMEPVELETNVLILSLQPPNLDEIAEGEDKSGFNDLFGLKNNELEKENKSLYESYKKDVLDFFKNFVNFPNPDIEKQQKLFENLNNFLKLIENLKLKLPENRSKYTIEQVRKHDKPTSDILTFWSRLAYASLEESDSFYRDDLKNICRLKAKITLYLIHLNCYLGIKNNDLYFLLRASTLCNEIKKELVDNNFQDYLNLWYSYFLLINIRLKKEHEIDKNFNDLITLLDKREKHSATLSRMTVIALVYIKKPNGLTNALKCYEEYFENKIYSFGIHIAFSQYNVYGKIISSDLFSGCINELTILAELNYRLFQSIDDSLYLSQAKMIYEYLNKKYPENNTYKQKAQELEQELNSREKLGKRLRSN